MPLHVIQDKYAETEGFVDWKDLWEFYASKNAFNEFHKHEVLMAVELQKQLLFFVKRKSLQFGSKRCY